MREDDMSAERCECLHVHKELEERLMQEIPEEEKLGELASFFKVFGDVTRIRILYALLCSEMCVCDLAQVLHMTQSAISHQLAVLKKSKLVKYRREGKTVFYSLSDGHVRTIIDQGMEHVSE